jgi:molybdopterin/thiamine biosynthesis adenylyltransferase
MDDTIYDTTRFHRQLGFINMRDLFETHVTVIGCGAIGSFSAAILAKMGAQSFTLWDDDRVEEHNLPNQYFSEADLSAPKVEALARVLKSFGAKEVTTCNSKFDNSIPASGIVIMAVDSMDTRASLWKSFIKNSFSIKVLIDPRMGGEFFRLYTLRPLNQVASEAYEKTLYTSKEATPEPCTEKSIIYNVGVVSSLIARQVKAYIMMQQVPFEIMCDLYNLVFISNEQPSGAF